MSNEIIKKISMPNSSLPALNAESLSYDVRYRIISEDKKLFSHWSPIYSLDPNYVFETGNISVSSSSNVVNIVWDAVNYKIGNNVVNKAKEYDIWIKWSRNNGTGDWIYKERVSSTSIGLPLPNTYFINGVDQAQSPNRFTIEVYLVGTPVTREFTGLRVYNPAIHTV